MTEHAQQAAKPLIYALMPKIMEDIGAIGKAHRTEAAGKYRYRSVEDALNALGPVLVQHGVCTSFSVLELHVEGREEAGDRGKIRVIRHAWLRAEVRFHAPDGSSIACVGAGEGVDWDGDKATNKAMAAAYKYAVFLGLSIPLEQGAAGDSDDGPPAPRVPPPAGAMALLGGPVPAPNIAPPAPTTGLISDSIRQQIYDQCDRAGVPTQELIAIVQRRGVQRIAELSATDGADILAKLTALPDDISEAPLPPGIPITAPDFVPF